MNVWINENNCHIHIKCVKKWKNVEKNGDTRFLQSNANICIYCTGRTVCWDGKLMKLAYWPLNQQALHHHHCEKASVSNMQTPYYTLYVQMFVENSSNKCNSATLLCTNCWDRACLDPVEHEPNGTMSNVRRGLEGYKAPSVELGSSRTGFSVWWTSGMGFLMSYDGDSKSE